MIKIGYKNTPKRSTEFKYDGQSRRIAIIETDTTGKTETRYTWCGDVICQARDAKDKPVAYYFKEGVYRPQAKSNKKEYYARDHLGSIRDVLDETGQSIARYDYDPYGKLIDGSGRMPEFGYAGMHYHAASGLYLTKYRAYDPKDGRWLSRDPIEEAGGVNLYSYVGGNPLSYIDPLGLATTVVINNNGWLGHAGVVVGSGKNAVLFDPGGSYHQKEKGSGDALYGRDVNLQDYIKFQKDDGPDVQIYTFSTTREEENQIKQNIEDGGCVPLRCAKCTSGVLSGIGPFKNLPSTLTPSGLGKELIKIQKETTSNNSKATNPSF
jgi:RHS repeat-associated protein